MSHSFAPSVLREYDIRGVVGQTLNSEDAYAIGRSFGTVVSRAGGRSVAVGYDGRLSSPMLEGALVRGLNDAGIHALRIGIGPTPMLYYAEAEQAVDGGIQITGSHNPADHNGFKFVLQHRPFFGADIQTLGQMAQSGDWASGSAGCNWMSVMDEYVDRLMLGFSGGAFRIGWDAGNGAAGPVTEKLVQRLPGEHYTLFTDIDGNFPNHHPDPTEDHNLLDLRALVARERLDFGVAFDGDGDRIGVIDAQGRAIAGDQLLALLAEPVLRERPNATIIADVKASQSVFERIAQLGGQPLMWKTGHSLMKSKMKETGSPLAGETTGHLFFGDDYYGFDDALYAAIRLIRSVHATGRSVTEMADAMPKTVSTPELRFPIEESRKFAVVDAIMARLRAQKARANFTDGARVDTDDGWWLLRGSNTQDMLVARAEGRDEAALARVLAELDSQLLAIGVSRPTEPGN